MGKRMTDTDKWTNNRWFQRLPSKYKLLWLYMWDICDNVGVWSADFDLAMRMLGPNCTFTEDEVREVFGKHIEVLNEETREWWIVEYCEFQHPDLCAKCNTSIAGDPRHKALISYIILLKQHDLLDRFIEWSISKGYARGLDTPQGKARQGTVRQGKEPIPEEVQTTIHEFINGTSKKMGVDDE